MPVVPQPPKTPEQMEEDARKWEEFLERFPNYESSTTKKPKEGWMAG
jgi:hypothetical protein